MNILVTGSSGLVGTAVTRHLTSLGHRVIPLERVRSGQGEAPATWDIPARRIDLSRAGPLDAVVHLAGESIAQRWTSSARERIRQSRVDGTHLLSAALAGLASPPRILLCASAVGLYGDRGDRWMEETDEPGTGFLAEVGRSWESASSLAEKAGIRTVRLRLGIILAREGGALAKMLPAFRAGLGGRLGDGKQYWSWVSLDDVIAAVEFCLRKEPMAGPVNVVAPHPVTNAEFTRTLARVLRRPAFLAVPSWAIRAVFGEMGREALLGSTRVRPCRLLESGFVFQHPTLDGALTSVLRGK